LGGKFVVQPLAGKWSFEFAGVPGFVLEDHPERVEQGQKFWASVQEAVLEFLEVSLLHAGNLLSIFTVL